MGKSHFKEDVRIILKVGSGTVRWDFWSVSNPLGRFFMETIIFGQWWRSHQSLVCQGFMYFQFLCYVLERWIRTQHQILCVGGKIEFVQRFIAIQNFGHNWRRADGIRDMFPQNSPHCSSSTKSKSSWGKWANPNNSKDESSSCRCPMTSHGDLKTMNGNAMLTSHLCLYSQKSSQQNVGHSSDLDQKRSGIPLTTKDHEENGTKSENRWWSDSEKADTQFSVPRVHCPEECSKAKEVENYQYTSVPMGTRLKLFFAQLFLLISSVSTEQSQICVMNAGPVKQIRGDPCWQDNLTHCSSQQVCWWQHLHLRLKFLHMKIIAKIQGTSEKALATKPSDKNLYWYKIPDNSWSRTVLHDKGHSRILKIYRIGGLSWVHFAKRWKKSSDPKGWIRGNTKIGPVLEVTTSYLQSKYGVEFRIESVNKDNFSLVGQNFSWIE